MYKQKKINMEPSEIWELDKFDKAGQQQVKKYSLHYSLFLVCL